MEIEKDSAYREVFTVVDEDGALVTGATGITSYLFDPNGNEVSGTTTVTVTELSDGHYEATFIPDVLGTWALTLIHTTYFPAGVSATYLCTEREEKLNRMLGLLQENFYIDQQVYTSGKLTSARIRTYSNAGSVGTSSNVLATYTVTATYSGDELTSYSVVKV